ncbi:pilus assembly protein [Agrococcus sp. BE272]|uniref:TadE family protein n=1 Tax=Agrococcus sp. BE272 TaxID=2817727 RepID=UPI00286D614B|nr:pilus assembly protein [Agrococcus sp. BE272]
MPGIRDRGAAAVEFALVLPLLALLTFGIIGFGYTFHVQTTIDNAARDGVRIFALTDGSTAPADARAATRAAAAPTLALTDAQIAVGPAGCPAGETARVTVTLTDFEPLGGFFGTLTLTGTGSMRCNG